MCGAPLSLSFPLTNYSRAQAIKKPRATLMTLGFDPLLSQSVLERFADTEFHHATQCPKIKAGLIIESPLWWLLVKQVVHRQVDCEGLVEVVAKMEVCDHKIIN